MDCLKQLLCRQSLYPQIAGLNRHLQQPAKNICSHTNTGPSMQLLTAIVPPSALASIQQALHALDVPGLTVAEVQRQALSAPSTRRWGQRLALDDSAPQLKLELVLAQEDLAPIVQVLQPYCTTAAEHGPHLLVQTVERAIRVRTGESSTAAPLSAAQSRLRRTAPNLPTSAAFE